MSNSGTFQTEKLNVEELTLALRALGAFQIQLYDRLSKSQVADVADSADLKIASSCIKKLHKMYERERHE
jgi:hypothetical protein